MCTIDDSGTHSNLYAFIIIIVIFLWLSIKNSAYDATGPVLIPKSA